jgi:6-phosphofructokinase 1
VILIPEISFGYEAIAEGVRDRVKRGRRFSIVVVAEGAKCPGGLTVVRQLVKDSPEPVRLGGIGAVVAHALEGLLPYEVRYVVLGHVQRGGPPTPFDRVLATRLGVAAIGALARADAGCMIALRGGHIEQVALAEVVGRQRCVDPEGERVAMARSVGTIFGDR